MVSSRGELVGTSHSPEEPCVCPAHQLLPQGKPESTEYWIVEHPWQDLAEPSKLAILEDAVNWSGITNRDRAHILLAEIDPGRIPDVQRNRLIDMAQAKPSLRDILQSTPMRSEARQQSRDIDRGMEW